MKNHQLTKWGLAAVGITFATVLPHTDELAQNTGSFLGGVKELACVAQDAFGGIVTVDAMNCSATGTVSRKPATPTGPSDSTSGN